MTYTAGLGRIDEVLPRYVEWLRGRFGVGVFLAAGREVRREGGVILAAGQDRAAIEALAATDPFAREGLAEYRVTQFAVGFTASDLDGCREQPPA
ncbi:YciI family protein [Kitasatospora sp. NPDC058190]|uniref:YciI family protein n=1 Tax=Kitasatospora sp. NPDC058190 TaxID=3346371 RepID=UPI0036DD21AA